MSHIPRRTYWVLREKRFFDFMSYHTDKCRQAVSEELGYLIASLCLSGNHAPALDLDFPVQTINSSGCSMLFLRSKISGKKFRRLLTALADCGYITGHDLVSPPVPLTDYMTEPDGFLLPLRAPHRLIPSSTPGHFHLYIDQEIPWRPYKKLLKAMYGAGLLGKKYYTMSLSHKKTYLLKPGMTKQKIREMAWQGKIPFRLVNNWSDTESLI